MKRKKGVVATLALSAVVLPVFAETCIVSGETDRPSASVDYWMSSAFVLDTRNGSRAMGAAEDLSPFESRTGSLEWGVPMNLNTCPPSLIFTIR